LGLVDKVHNFCCTAQFLRNFCSCCPLNGKDRPITANATTVKVIQKGVDTTLSRQFVAVQLPGVYCRNVRCSIVPETYRPTHRRTFLHPRAAPLSPVSQQWAIGFVLENRYVTIYVMISLGSRKSLLLVTALYSLHTYRIVVVTAPLCETCRGMMSVVG